MRCIPHVYAHYCLTVLLFQWKILQDGNTGKEDAVSLSFSSSLGTTAVPRTSWGPTEKGRKKPSLQHGGTALPSTISSSTQYQILVSIKLRIRGSMTTREGMIQRGRNRADEEKDEERLSPLLFSYHVSFSSCTFFFYTFLPFSWVPLSTFLFIAKGSLIVILRREVFLFRLLFPKWY